VQDDNTEDDAASDLTEIDESPPKKKSKAVNRTHQAKASSQDAPTEYDLTKLAPTGKQKKDKVSARDSIRKARESTTTQQGDMGESGGEGQGQGDLSDATERPHGKSMPKGFGFSHINLHAYTQRNNSFLLFPEQKGNLSQGRCHQEMGGQRRCFFSSAIEVQADHFHLSF
jgi:hypothetical protein